MKAGPQVSESRDITNSTVLSPDLGGGGEDKKASTKELKEYFSCISHSLNSQTDNGRWLYGMLFVKSIKD